MSPLFPHEINASLKGKAAATAYDYDYVESVFIIGTGRAVLKHERVWWVCTPVHGLFMIIAWILLLPFAIKTYCVVLCKFCKKNTAETEVTSDHAQAQAVAAAYAAGKADAESCAADAAKLAQPEKEPVSVVVEGTVLDVPTPNAQPDDAV